MLEFALPYIIALALDMDLPTEQQAMSEATASVEAASAATAAPAAAPSAARTPEPQTPTGKYTTAVEVKPILSVTKASWIAVRPYDGQDLLYFTNIMAWRCGLWEIRYGLNGAPATDVMTMEPCYEDTAQPNAMTDIANFLPFLSFPLDSIETISLELHFDDGTIETAEFARADVQIQ